MHSDVIALTTSTVTISSPWLAWHHSQAARVRGSSTKSLTQDRIMVDGKVSMVINMQIININADIPFEVPLYHSLNRKVEVP